MIVGAQIRAARALLGWSQSVLANAANVGIATVKRIEASDERPSGNVETNWKLQISLESAGVEFIKADDAGGIGVRLSKPAS